VTIEPLMSTVERVTCLGIVIETPARPAVRVVTQGAISRQPAFVMGILVAARTAALRVFERSRAMAFLAGRDRMTANQWKSRDLVIEGHIAPPARFLVALFATAAELSFVGIVFLVTRHAIRCELVAIEVAAMTGIAFDLRMLAPQGELGLVMIEAHRLPLA